MGDEFAEMAQLYLISGTVCLLFGALAGHVLGPGVVHRTRRLVRGLRR